MSILNPLKEFYQRGKRGYADSDVWSFDHYLARVISGGLQKLIEDEIGHPNEFTDIEEWREVLRKMKAGFDEAISIFESPGIDEEVFDEGMKLFHKHFFSLWT